MGKKAAAAMLGTQLTRVNWGKGDALTRITQAVEDWDKKSGEILEKDSKISLKEYASKVEIPFQTLHKYAQPNHGKRQKLGSSVGTKPLFDADQELFAVDVIYSST